MSVETKARLTDRETSQVAASLVGAADAHAAVLDMLGHGPMTDYEMEVTWRRYAVLHADAVDWSPQRLRTARAELEAAGFVGDSGVRRKARRSDAIVWRLL